MGRKPKNQNSQPEGEAMETITLQLNLGDSVEPEQDKEEFTKETISDILDQMNIPGVTRLESGLVPAIVPGPITENDLRAAREQKEIVGTSAGVEMFHQPSQADKVLNTLLDFSKSDGESLARMENQLRNLNTSSVEVQSQVATLASETTALKASLVGFNSLVEAVSSLKQAISDLKQTQAIQQEALLAALSSLNVVANPKPQEVSKVSETAPQEATEASNQGQLPWEDPTTSPEITRGLLIEELPVVCYNAVIDFLPELERVSQAGKLQVTVQTLANSFMTQLCPLTAQDTPEDIKKKKEELQPKINKAIVQLFSKMGWGEADSIPKVTDNYKQFSKKAV